MGIIIATITMSGVKVSVSLSRSVIEEKARGFGMRYPEDFKVINKEDVKK